MEFTTRWDDNVYDTFFVLWPTLVIFNDEGHWSLGMAWLKGHIIIKF